MVAGLIRKDGGKTNVICNGEVKVDCRDVCGNVNLTSSNRDRELIIYFDGVTCVKKCEDAVIFIHIASFEEREAQVAEVGVVECIRVSSIAAWGSMYFIEY